MLTRAERRSQSADAMSHVVLGFSSRGHAPPDGTRPVSAHTLDGPKVGGLGQSLDVGSATTAQTGLRTLANAR